jgi:thiol:disulfide interchange protein DsbA
MQRIALLLIALVVPALPNTATAQMLWEPGVHFEAITPAVPTSTPGKVEVMEVFSYGCPYCYQAYPLVEKIKASLPPYAQMNYVHASFIPQEAWPMFQRAYLTAKAMGIADANHLAMFQAIWQTGEIPLIDQQASRPVRPLPDITAAAKFYAKHAGIKAEDFVARSAQPDIDEQMRQSDKLIAAYGINGTPAFVINGRYRTGKGIKTSDDMIRVISYLVSLERSRITH